MEQITIRQNENQTITIKNKAIEDINIKQNEIQKISISNNTSQNLNIKQKENQIIYIDNGGSAIGISDVLVNGVSVVSNNIAYIIVPTKTSELQNNSGFITTETDPTVPSYIKAISLADINNWNNKQDELISGSTIKTINNTSLLGYGNINVGGENYVAGYGINITNNEISNTIVSYNDLEDLPSIPTKTSDLLNDSDYVTENELSNVAYSGSYADLSNIPVIPDSTSELINDSGFINKNVNDLTYYPLTNSLSTVATTGNYNDLSNKPTIPTKTSQLTNDSGFINKNINDLTYYPLTNSLSTVATTGNYNDLSNKPTIPTKTSQLTNDSGFITNNYQIYSLNEIRIGTWITGKPLYRQVFRKENVSNSYSIPLPSNLNIFTKMEVIQMDSDNAQIPAYYWNSSDYLRIFKTTSGIQIRTTKPSNTFTHWITVEYTKTTD